MRKSKWPFFPLFIMYTCVCVPCECPVAMEASRGCESLTSGITDGCQLPCGCREPNPGPLEKQTVFLIFLLIKFKTKSYWIHFFLQYEPIRERNGILLERGILLNCELRVSVSCCQGRKMASAPLLWSLFCDHPVGSHNVFSVSASVILGNSWPGEVD